MKKGIRKFASLTLAVLMVFSTFAACTPNKVSYTVIFEANASGVTSLPADQTVEQGKTASQPEDPIRNGYDFLGWYTEEECVNRFDFSTPITASMVMGGQFFLFARWAVQTTYFNVQFNLDYTNAPSPTTEKVASGQPVTPPQNPVREGFEFSHWSATSKGESAYNFSQAITQDRVLYAVWIELFEVSFDLDYQGGTAPAAQKVRDGESADMPASPARTGYEFLHWSVAKNGAEFDFHSPIEAATTLYAVWVKTWEFTFNLNYTGAAQAQPIIVRNNQTVDEPEQQPVRTGGWRFEGWFSLAEGGSEFNFQTPITADTTVYAQWQDISLLDLVQVTFNYNYADSPAAMVVDVERNTKVGSTTPTRTGYQFLHWSLTDGGAAFNFNTAITDNTTLYANWVKVWTFTYNFNYIDAPAPATQIVKNNETANVGAITLPNRAGLVVEGWYNEAACTTAYSFSTAVTADKTVYAKWVSADSGTFKVDFNYEGADSFAEGSAYNRTYSAGDRLPTKAPTIPTRPRDLFRPAWITGNHSYEYDYEFIGWSATANGAVDPSLANVFGSTFSGESLTLYAQWKHTYVFEAEYVDLTNFIGSSISGVAVGSGAILAQNSGGGAYPDPKASNGYFISYLYGNGININFNITSDRATTAILWVRMSAELANMVVTDEEYKITVNGAKVSYSTVSISVESPYNSLGGPTLPFTDYVGVEVQLAQGDNSISLVTNNSKIMGNQLSATAPTIDCIKLDTTAKLTWTKGNPDAEDWGKRGGPVYWNLSRFFAEDYWWLPPDQRPEE